MAAGFLAAVVLWFWPGAPRLPGLPFAYACPVYSLTGVLCMGCGATRALRSLLTGNLLAAMRQNLLAVILLAGLLWQGLARLVRRLPGWAGWRLAARAGRLLPARLRTALQTAWEAVLKPAQPALRSVRQLLVRLFPVLRPGRRTGWWLLAAGLAFMLLRNLNLPVSALLRP